MSKKENIEDLADSHKIIAALATEATRSAARSALEGNIEITILRGDQIVKLSPDGSEKLISTYPNHRRKVVVGSKDTL